MRMYDNRTLPRLCDPLFNPNNPLCKDRISHLSTQKRITSNVFLILLWETHAQSICMNLLPVLSIIVNQIAGIKQDLVATLTDDNVAPTTTNLERRFAGLADPDSKFPIMTFPIISIIRDGNVIHCRYIIDGMCVLHLSLAMGTFWGDFYSATLLTLTQIYPKRLM